MKNLWDHISIWLMVPYEPCVPVITTLIVNYYAYNINFKLR